MNPRRAGDGLPALVSLIPAVLIAYYVLGKATRDALFVANVGLPRLPLASAVGAFLSLAVLPVVSRFTVRLGPARFLFRMFAITAVLLVAEWAIGLRNPRLASIVAYLQLASSGPFLISGFWSWLNERIEPRGGKSTVGRLVAMGTLGGAFGGALGLELAKTAAPAL